MNPMLLKDGYKVGHIFQYPADTRYVYSNFTPRNTRRPAHLLYNDGVVWFGLQYFLQEYLVDQFNENFFDRPRDEVVAEYDRRITHYLGPINVDHIGALHDLGYLPLRIKALPEGTLVPYGIPPLTIINTHPGFFWLTNMLETLMSAATWKASTSATTALGFRRTFEKFAELTGASKEFIPWQGHDFSMRGMSGIEDAMVSGAGHLLCFTGTDTIPSIDFLEMYYGANAETELVGGSVPATEHSVMCMGEPNGELDLFRRLIVDIYPGGTASVVSDTWDLWTVINEYLPKLRDEILARDGKLVIRPDSGDPVDIVCGDPSAAPGTPQFKGVVQCLWDTFGGTTNDLGFRTLDPHIGVIYGDGINSDRQQRMFQRLADKGFASDNVVLGLGSFTYQLTTRDTDGWAMKATAGITDSKGLVAIFKDPVTDDGGKRSAAGLLCVTRDENGKLVLEERVTAQREEQGELQTVFHNGEITQRTTLAEIRARVEEIV